MQDAYAIFVALKHRHSSTLDAANATVVKSMAGVRVVPVHVREGQHMDTIGSPCAVRTPELVRRQPYHAADMSMVSSLHNCMYKA